jgi:ApaG protein
VRSDYLEHQSVPQAGRFVFSYSVQIANEGPRTIRLMTRHWIISDAEGNVREVRGEGVVGRQPVLLPNEAFQYESGCVLRTPWGTMQGTYQMHLEDGSQFDAEIAPFLLASKSVVTVQGLN